MVVVVNVDVVIVFCDDVVLVNVVVVAYVVAVGDNVVVFAFCC